MTRQESLGFRVESRDNPQRRHCMAGRRPSVGFIVQRFLGTHPNHRARLGGGGRDTVRTSCCCVAHRLAPALSTSFSPLLCTGPTVGASVGSRCRNAAFRASGRNSPVPSGRRLRGGTASGTLIPEAARPRALDYRFQMALQWEELTPDEGI